MSALGWVIFAVGVIGSIYLSRKYTMRVTQVMLTITGGLSLWIISVLLYTETIANPVPKILGLVILPVISLIFMALIIRKVPKVDSKQKRKNE